MSIALGVPNKPKTPTRTVRVPDELWTEALEASRVHGETVADVLTRALHSYVQDGWRERALAAEAELARLKGEQ